MPLVMRNSRQSNSWRFAVRPAETQTLLGICRGHIKQQASEGERQICDEAKAKTGLHRTLIQRRVRRLFETASRRQSGPKTTWCSGLGLLRLGAAVCATSH